MPEISKPVNVVVFDLNGTFYKKASKDEFYKFLVAKNPKRAKYFFEIAYYKLLKLFHLINHTEFKENFFDYLNHMEPEKVYQLGFEFWNSVYPQEFNKELKQRFDEVRSKGAELVCITGAFEVYVKPLFDHFYAVDFFSGTRTRYENETYHIIGEACKGKEKLKRLDEYYRDRPYRIVEAYSDSCEDLFERAEKAFLVEDGKIKSVKK